nr:NADH dehydrogenase subunit 6 [Geomys breviceps]UFK29065.1 NADH dehydrogenase subunit 6 [Geomys breviceps]
MIYLNYLLLVAMVGGFLVVAVKPSPIYAGLGLIISGGAGCGLLLYHGCSYMGLMVYLIYLGGMLVVFGYTTALATEEYPEDWGSNVWVWFLLLSGIILEVILIVLFMDYGGLEWLVASYESMDFMGYDEEVFLIREDSVGAGSMYSFGGWLMVISGWSLFVGVFIIIEITRGI